ncbi:glycoside hydrolase family 3 protein [Bipolaris maydis ATCC 48331]|uniref:beta-glucosidase n=2 Tax=Cochliobolus heterostrophus TaxID=5016 RepID=M2U7W1_COCH5|nr:glycoside hydrolase family 3 protein [Bipolaris maydis ATCC 48331]EMD94619.1 glycoside hydrolase family 3 protein [Bipolaris maydis C5]KAH7556157.1 glycoside hydrolase family 3 protein [Bipolaris maydis]ENI01667.1 glycoside hydrolase family 3 protein [Bipolaris maydis ATCC 48331]KAJ5029056.1 glycoside hydrolase [Bipolaris maydis]KAJ5062218.1 glycoside hydrolase superfamily [Bipolaris maydis]
MTPVPELLERLTVEEKISLLAATDWWRTPVIDRNGVYVPQIKMSDGPNGARGESYVSGITAACFPCSTCVGATFDVSSAYRLGQEIAREAHTKSAKVLLAPTMNIIRSPLGGRNYETFSEDPYLIGTLAAAFVNGCQSEGIAATPKHFVANDSEKRRTKMTSQIDEQTLREIYMLPFQLVMRESDPWCFMTSYNRLNGEYCADSHRLLETILRKEWGFRGAVVSDWMGTYSTATAIKAGLDLEMPGPTKQRGQKLLDAINCGELELGDIDKCVMRVLELAVKTGCFENPKESPEKSVIDEDRLNFITDVAAEGMVLLKNAGNILPVARSSRIAVIGEFATNPSIGGGGSAKVLAQHIVSPLDGFQLRGINCQYSAGVPVSPTLPHIPTGSSVHLEWFNGSVIGMNRVHEQDISNAEYMIKEAWPTYLDENYCTLMRFSLTPGSTGDHMFSVITTGEARVFLNGTEIFHRPQEQDLMLESFYFYKSKIERRFSTSMIQGQTYEVEVHSWATDPSVLARINGRMFQGSSLRFREYVDIPKAIEEAADTAANVDYALVFVGNTNEIESEGYDRDTMDLSHDQYRLIAAVTARNPKTVVINFSGSPVTVSPFIEQVPAFLQSWFPGQECGHSVAKVVLGEVNPSGRLPLSWPKKNEDNPAYGNFPCDDNDVLVYEEGLKVGYRYYDDATAPEPQFHFGSGLSYTNFTLSHLQIESKTFKAPEDVKVKITCDLTNTGPRDGKQVVQIYVGPRRNTSRPIKELKAFTKVFVKAGTKRSVSVDLTKYAFSSYNTAAGKWQLNAGDYCIYASFSAKIHEQVVQIHVPETQFWTGV